MLWRILLKYILTLSSLRLQDNIKSWGAYICIFALFLLSNYLISAFDLASYANGAFKYGNAIETVASKLHPRGSLIANEWRERRGSTMVDHLRRSSIVADELDINCEKVRNGLEDTSDRSEVGNENVSDPENWNDSEMTSKRRASA